jgi:hypothetical protein
VSWGSEVVPRGIMASLYIVKKYPPASGIFFLVTNIFRHFVKNVVEKRIFCGKFPVFTDKKVARKKTKFHKIALNRHNCLQL